MFVVAVVLKQAPWRVAFIVLVNAVAAWAFRAPAVVGASLGACPGKGSRDVRSRNRKNV
ncbi:hypothetical protein [Thermomonospora echinospora]|uniref:hypothetical protein n=1 Tax=Thermomonospora echinospora TaxID=1992 RepID=UPI00135CB27E|nr:hypothetical protein [Thermomonospora echinospora]